DHLVDAPVFLRHVREREGFAAEGGHVFEPATQRRQHAEAQHVHLEQAQVVEIVLSHSMTVRSAMAAFSMGTSSSSRPCEITKPPTCCDRCRGNPCSSPASSSSSLSWGLPGSKPASRTRSSSTAVSHHCMAPARRSACTVS